MNFFKLLKSWKSVFRIDDLKLLLDTNNENTIRNYLSRAQKRGLLKNIYYGIWCLVDKKVNIFEFACKLRKKSYISFETVLKREAVIFQHYGENIFLASNNSIQKQALQKEFTFLKIKDSILLNPIWIIHKWNFTIASTERAICDRIYLSKNYYFDDLSNINFEKLKEISKIYNKRVILEVKNLIKNAK